MSKGHTEYEDLLQCNNLPSSATPRGHQFPAAFMIMASGLEKVSLPPFPPWPSLQTHEPTTHELGAKLGS